MGTARCGRLICFQRNIAEVNVGYLRRFDSYHGYSTGRSQFD